MVRFIVPWLGPSLLMCQLASAAGLTDEASETGHSVSTHSAYTAAEVAGRGQFPNDAREDESRPYSPTSSPFVYDRRRATTSLREISQHVSKMKQRSKKAMARSEFDPKRADETLQQVKSFVAEMKQRTKAAERTTTGPIEGVYVHQYNRVRVPTPQRIEETSGLTHHEFAELRLREKGYVKTIAGWVPPQHQQRVSQRKSKRKVRQTVAQASTNDPF